MILLLGFILEFWIYFFCELLIVRVRVLLFVLDLLVERVMYWFFGKDLFVLDKEGVVGFDRKIFFIVGCLFFLLDKDDSFCIMFVEFVWVLFCVDGMVSEKLVFGLFCRGIVICVGWNLFGKLFINWLWCNCCWLIFFEEIGMFFWFWWVCGCIFWW